MTDQPELDNGEPGAAAAQPDTPGARLKAARELKGLSLQDVATRTRIARRQLEAIERDDYEALPGIPYAIGFARAYARAVDLDEVATAADVRRAVSVSDLGSHRYEAFEPADPARVPSRTLAWTAAAIVILVVAGFAVWRTQMLAPPEIFEPQAAPSAAAPAPVAGAPAPSVAQKVVFTANDDVWLRIYDEAGERLKDGLLKKGEQFTLPDNARNPMILTGRPQAVSVTVGGKAVPTLGAADRTIADVPVSAGALLARISAATPAAAVPPPVGTPIPSASSQPSPRRSAAPASAPARQERDDRPTRSSVPAQSAPAADPAPSPAEQAPAAPDSTPPA